MQNGCSLPNEENLAKNSVYNYSKKELEGHKSYHPDSMTTAIEGHSLTQKWTDNI